VIHLLGGGDSKGGIVLKYVEETEAEIGYYFVQMK
jgi:hypothetical protein